MSIPQAKPRGRRKTEMDDSDSAELIRIETGMKITEAFEDGAFSAEVTHCMARAFEQACTTLRGGGHSDLIQEIIAKQIVRYAREGIVDPSLLCREALASLGLDAG